jgi:hypothetical protein
MKKSAIRMLVAFVVCALSSSMAFAGSKVRSTVVTFGMDFTVGETLVKKGTYKLSFDETKSELTVLAKDKSVVAKTVAHLEDRKTSSFGMEIILTQTSEPQALVSVAFPGANKSVVIEVRNAQAAMAR